MRVESLIDVLAIVFLTTCTTTSLVSSEDEQIAQRDYDIPGHGILKLAIPVSWNQEIEHPARDPRPTMVLTPPRELSGKILITVNWYGDGVENRKSPEEIKDRVKLQGERLLAEAVEEALDVHELKGKASVGYYYILTDKDLVGKAPEPGDYKYALQGLISVGDLVLFVTVLSNEKESDFTESVLKVLASAEHHPSVGHRQDAEDLQLEETILSIPGESWVVSFLSPPLSDRKEHHQGDSAFQATSTSRRFCISVFVERPRARGETNRDCYSYYWSRARENTLIDSQSVRTSENRRYVRVQYDILAELNKGRNIRLRNVHYYFVYRRKWIDVHISITNPTPDDERIFTAFDASLYYGRNGESQVRPTP